MVAAQTKVRTGKVGLGLGLEAEIIWRAGKDPGGRGEGSGLGRPRPWKWNGGKGL